MTLAKLLLLAALTPAAAGMAQNAIVLKSGAITFTADPNGFRYSFAKDGKPAVYRQVSKATFATVPIEVGKQNDDDVIVTSGLKEGDVVTLESPAEAAKRAKKKL